MENEKGTSREEARTPRQDNGGVLEAKRVNCASARSARRRRLELRRLGRTASAAAEDDAAKRVRCPVPVVASDSSSSDSSDSAAKVAPEPPPTASKAVTKAPACVSHGAVSVIGRRREMEDAVAIAAPFLPAAASGVEEEVDGGKMDEGDEGFFAVFDGHGGSRVAEACRERMHVVLAEEVERLRRLDNLSGDDLQDGAATARWKEAMAACFARVDGEVAEDDEDEDAAEQHTVGSTAVVAVVGPRRIVVANCGDSRAVLSRGGVAVPLSCDHKQFARTLPRRRPGLFRQQRVKRRVASTWPGPGSHRAASDTSMEFPVGARPRFPAWTGVLGLGYWMSVKGRSLDRDRPDELERVEAAGGRVINWNGYRVLATSSLQPNQKFSGALKRTELFSGALKRTETVCYRVLATSRSIGDYYLKPYVTAEPEVTVMDRTDKDEFLILASDGLWDVVSNEVACKIARNCLSGLAASKYPESVSGSSAADAAALLVELAISRGSNDNISVVVVELRRLKSRKKASRQNGR
ncbi:hypothetical protein PR202_ga10271 [Eleusine coracana subsp. coracana]|uniref:protein-serine/threonine phosphatase n=1 Tax=Eleusine coracana subsp. coracana TaxID=191504 RepID=A0AAV5C696_ELECO|nr:hypothetical protein PR202_ga10271 [Eleusine coracana subsp. coracana]